MNNAIDRSYKILFSIILDPVISKSNHCFEFKNAIEKALDDLGSKTLGISFQEVQNDDGTFKEEMRRAKAISILQEIDQKVDNIFHALHPNKAESIHSKLLRAQRLFNATNTTTPYLKPHVRKIDFSIFIVCDIDAPDKNGAIEKMQQDLFTSKVPFITTPSFKNERLDLLKIWIDQGLFKNESLLIYF